MDHLSRLENHDNVFAESLCIREEFLDEQLLELDVTKVLWYGDIVNLLVASIYPLKVTSQKKKMLFYDFRANVWDELFLKEKMCCRS